MDTRQTLITAVVLAFIGWLAAAALVTGFSPGPVLRYVFLVLVALSTAATLLPVVYYLHLRFGDAKQNPHWWRYVRQSLWVGVLVSFCLWLSSLQALSVPVVLLGVCIVALIEIVILKPVRSES